MTAIVASERRIVVEPRGRPSAWSRVVFPLASIAGAGLVGSVLLLATGHLPGVALALGNGLPAIATVALVLVAGAIGGGLWAALAALPRAYLRTDEVITTL